MIRSPILAGLLSAFVPGLGQMVCGLQERGAAILLAAVGIASLQALFLAAYDPTGGAGAAFWSVTLARIVHDIAAMWSVAFWIWVVYDAVRQARRAGE